ncbi:Zn(II)2Cys6 transcription factor [Aspergillus avenaceus]|uniref:Zn(II)2Cys6 transcription factor n=1 Tax=Aspergillus avenaceus TaxID=36643 RepID=A0A5N6TQ11_ASPAV|nr:Zn(II)2Cys6 transcription factor [Aspergillus avenaceus]
MVYGGKPSTGCYLCRKRKIKCDEALPECRNCAVYGRPCPGYRSDTIFRNETQKVARLMKRKRYSSNDSSQNRLDAPVWNSNDKPPLPSCYVSDSTWEERAVCYFFDQYANCDTSDECLNHLAFLPSLYATCQDSGQDGSASSSLRLAVEAAALATLSNRLKAAPLLLKARGYYGMALRELRSILGSQSQAVRDETFATMVILSIFEDISGERNGLASPHTKGFGLLLKLRGEDQISHSQGRDLFICAYAHTLIENIVLRSNPGTGTDLIVGQLDSSEPVHRLLLTAAKLGQVVTESAPYQGSLDPDAIPKLIELIQISTFVDLEMVEWTQHLPDDWLPLMAHSQTGETFLTYQNMSLAAIWTYYRAARLGLQRHLLELRRTLSSIAGDSQAYEIYRDAALDEILDLTTDTCRSIPFSLGDVDALGVPMSQSGDQPPIRALYGYLMLWPLWYVLSLGFGTTMQMEQIRNALGRVGSVLGIKLALTLAQPESMSWHISILTPNQYPLLSSMG